MPHWWTVFGPVLAIFGVIAAGTAMRRINWLTEEADHTLLKLNINLLLPCLIFTTIVGNPALHNPQNVWLPPLVGFGTVCLGFAAALLLARAVGRWIGLTTPAQVGTFAFCVGLYNYGYIPIPLVADLFSTAANPDAHRGTLGVLFVHNVGVDLCMFTVGLALVAGARGGRPWWRSLVNAPGVTIVIALILNLVDWSWLPGWAQSAIGNAVGMLGACAIPMALLLIGATVADHLPALHPRNGRGGGGVYLAAVALRLGILPVAFLALAWVLPASTELRRVMIVEAAMPSAVMPIVLARHYGGDTPTALRVVLGTSLVSLVTIPLWIAVGMRVMGSGW